MAHEYVGRFRILAGSQVSVQRERHTRMPEWFTNDFGIYARPQQVTGRGHVAERENWPFSFVLIACRDTQT